jgi:TolB-like protein/tetratricopeptide (TPR) repeat protein
MPAQASSERVHQELEKLLSSRGFARNERMTMFLRYVVEQQLEGKAIQLKETLIGVEVFGRKPDYDPKMDPIVRTEAARLRTRLAEYYAGEGAADRVLIELPKGGYAPVIRSRDQPVARRGALWRTLWARPWLKAALAAIVLALAGAGWWIARPKPERPVIAVLPFKNLSAEPESEFFVDGLTDEVIRNFSLIEGVEVKSRTSSFAFKNKPRNIREVGEQLRANLVVDGSVFRSGGRLRISAQLIRVSGDRLLWSGAFERELKDVFAIQDEISRAIVGELRLKLPTVRKKWPTESPEAYTFYLRGRSALEPGTAAGAKTALQFFERALALDPGYAQANAGVAEAYHFLAFTGVLPPKEAYPRVDQAARKALARDESLPEAHMALARVKYAYEWDWPGAERELRQAIELNPNSAYAHENYGMIVLSLQGRVDEALEQIRLAESLDPLSPRTRWLHASVLFFARRYTEAIAESRRTLDMDPSYVLAYQMIGQCYEQQGRWNEAIEMYLRSSPSGGNLGRTYALAGRTEEARKILSDLRRRYEEGHARAMDVSAVYVGLGDREQAFEWLEKACERREYLVVLKVGPGLDPLRSDARFDQLLRRVGLLPTAATSRAYRN